MSKFLSVVMMLSISSLGFASDFIQNPTKNEVRNELWFAGVQTKDRVDQVIEQSYAQETSLDEEVSVALDLLDV